MLFVASLLLLNVFALLITYIRYHFAYWERRGVPHEKPQLLVGNYKGIGKTHHFRDINQRIYDQFKGTAPFAGMYMFFTQAAFIMDLDLVKNILIKDFSNFHDRGVFNNVRDDPLTGHLFTLEGEQWRAMRTKLTPVFTSGKMKFMFPTVVGVGKQLSEACGKLMLENAENAVEMKELNARFTTDVIASTAFGIECHSLEDPTADFRQKGRAIFEQPRHSHFVQAFMSTNPKLARKMRLQVFTDEVSDFFLQAVRRTAEYRVKNGVKRNDFMDLLIEMKAEDEELARKGNGIDLSHGLTIEQMAAQVFVFFVAGFDTSATTMSFCLYELALNPKIQEKLRTEITTVLKKHDDELTYEAMTEMVYLEQVLCETLRKHPVLPHLVRKTVNDYTVPNTELVIQKGTIVVIPNSIIHHDPEYYPNPEKFDPTRFTPEAIRDRHSCAYIPFGDGPRNCIGFRFGKMQAKIGLISLLKDYKFSKSSRTQIPLQYSKKNFLINADKGIYLSVDRV